MAREEIDLERLQALAALRIEADERERLRDELSRLLDYVDQLQEIDEASLPDHGPDAPAVRLREDCPHPGLGTEQALSQAPSRHDDRFDVPGVMGGDS